MGTKQPNWPRMIILSVIIFGFVWKEFRSEQKTSVLGEFQFCCGFLVIFSFSSRPFLNASFSLCFFLTRVNFSFLSRPILSLVVSCQPKTILGHSVGSTLICGVYNEGLEQVLCG